MHSWGNSVTEYVIAAISEYIFMKLVAWKFPNNFCAYQSV